MMNPGSTEATIRPAILLATAALLSALLCAQQPDFLNHGRPVLDAHNLLSL